MPVPPRFARLVLVTPDGAVLGALPPARVAAPWWQDAETVVHGAREAFGVDVVVLRLLEADRPAPPSGVVTYLAELRAGSVLPVGLEPWTAPIEDHALRLPWARPGGPDADLAWAAGEMARAGLRPAGRPEQVRTWNLSSLWRIPVEGQTVWLKHVPPFFAHEGTMLELLAGGPVPRLVAHDGARTLLEEILGEDQYDAELPTLLRAIPLLVGLQASWVGRTDELLACGLPDWRGPALMHAITDTVERTRAELAPHDARTLDTFVDDLPRRIAAIDAAGLPDTLVHGDFSPGNLRGTPGALVLLDWGDSGVGHPLLDQPAMFSRVAEGAIEPLRRVWSRGWREAIPGCDPERAAALLGPVAAARQAVIYRTFLDNIEPSEHPYHAADPADWLTRAAQLARSEAR
jgi:hypothetical protein